MVRTQIQTVENHLTYLTKNYHNQDMRFLPFYLVKKIYKLKYLTYKYILKPTKPIKSVYGVYLTPSFKDTTFMYCYKGTYGFFLSDLIKNILCETIFIDIGANQGLYSVLAGKNNNIKKIIAFEPTKKTAQLLRTNIASNQIQNCTIIEKGVSNKKGTFNISVADGHSGKNTLRTIELEENTNSEQIETINHEDIELLFQEKTNYIIKIDVEGHEEVVIDELIKCSFIQNVSSIFCEIDAKWVNEDNIKKKLTSVGFSKFEKIGIGNTHYDILISRD